MVILLLLAVLGAIDVIAGLILFSQTINFVKFVGLILVWKGLITLFFYLKAKLKK